jgi:signal transduction histidine kinase
MTITKRLGIGYATVAAACLLLLGWLWYHEFVEEPAEFAARGLSDLHKDTAAELSTLIFLALIPVLLGLGWWWTRHVLAPLRALTEAAERIGPHTLHTALPRSMNDDEVDMLAAVFASMTSRLDASFQQIREFTLHASHELKTPLAVMRAQLETILRENASLPAEQTAWIDVQLDEIKRLTLIVDSLTLLTKADAGLVKLERNPVNLHTLVAEAFEDAQVLAQPQGVRVELAGCDDVLIQGDRHRLRQLLLILTDNAVKFNRPGGTIEMALRRQNATTAELRVTNTGARPDSKTLKNAFDRFVRGENAEGKVEGCGLGLTIAQWIVHAHGGEIQLRADPDGRTTAAVTFHTLAPEPAPAAIEALVESHH